MILKQALVVSRQQKAMLSSVLKAQRLRCVERRAAAAAASLCYPSAGGAAAALLPAALIPSRSISAMMAVAAVVPQRGLFFGTAARRQRPLSANISFVSSSPTVSLFSALVQQQQPVHRLLLPLSPSLLVTPESNRPFSTYNQEMVVYNRASASTSTTPLPPLLATSILSKVLSILLTRFKILPEIRIFVAQKQAEKGARQKQFAKTLRDLLKAVRKRQQILSKHDKWAIIDYTGPGFAVMNQALREGSASASSSSLASLSPSGDHDDLQKRIHAVLRAMSKSRKLKVFTGVVYRGVQLPSEIADTLQPGATFADPAFLSTSLKKDEAFLTGKDNTTFYIESRTGVDVSSFSKHKKEAEVLFRPNTTFQIQSVERRNDGLVTLVCMKELH